jgi:hypothetical protein
MKKKPSPSKPRRNALDVQQAIGGQPENDQDAREAGLPSATSAKGAKPAKGNDSPSRPKAKKKT